MGDVVKREPARLSAEGKSGEMAAFLPLINQARSIAPRRVGFGYREVGGGGYAAGIASYTNARSAWLAFSVLEMAKKLIPIPQELTVRSATVGSASGYFISMEEAGCAYVLRNGGSVIGFATGKSTDEALLRKWAEAHLARK